ncbi:MAG: DNA polymerase I, partial [Candidatus Sumerlaeota bacterium]|nr:DNA polymerase I [Candidatus Sumerlaeota bacterium]
RVKNPRQRQLLEQGRDSARLSRELATIQRDLPLSVDWDRLRWAGQTITPALNALFRELGFKTLVVEETADASDLSDSPERLKEIPARYSTIETEEALREFVERVSREAPLAVDTETDAIDPMRAGLVGISLSRQAGEAVYIPVGHHLPGETARQLDLTAVRRIVGPVLADPAVPKTGQNIKYDLKILRRHGMPIEGIAFDTSLADYLLDPGGEHGLKSMSKRHLGIDQTPIAQLIGSGKSQITMADVPVADATNYACQDADYTLRLTERLGKALEREGLVGLLRDMELPLIEILANMEMEGVRLDVGHLRRLAERMKDRLKNLTREIHEAAGHPFNINSTKQVAAVLFDELKLKPLKEGKTGYSTDLSVLEKLADLHPLPRLLVEYRLYDKLLGTYVEPLPSLVNPQTGRLHCSFSQIIAATGRLSCHDPNLQNIPVRSDLGREIRRAFVPNREGEALLAADYSQIELRVLAHLTRDEALLGAFRRNEDIHRLTASRIFGCPIEMITDDMRSQAKVVNFGIIYGMSASSLADQFRISRPGAQKFIDEYFAAYPRVKAWMDGVLDEARRTGLVKTLSGRLRKVADLNSRSVPARRAAERIAINTPVQGTAADLIKLAMIRIHKRLSGSSLRARMLLQIHDELIFTVPAAEADDLGALVKEEMEQALPLEAPVKVDVAVGANWAEC